MSIRLTDEEIKAAKAEAKRLSWTHKAHPRFEEEKYLLAAQLKKIVGLLKACDGELVSRNNKPFMATFEMPVEVYQEMLKGIEL